MHRKANPALLYSPLHQTPALRDCETYRENPTDSGTPDYSKFDITPEQDQAEVAKMRASDAAIAQ